VTQPSGFTDLGPERARAQRPVASWVGEPDPRGGLPLYLELLRSKLWLVALVVAVSVLAAVVFVARAEKVYRADADLLVTPIPRSNTNLFGFGLVSETGDPTRDAETVAQLITTPAVAQRVRETLGLEESARSLENKVVARPVAQSSIVTVTATANDPELAARLANAFGQGAIVVRTDRLHRLVAYVIPRLRRQLNQLPASDVTSRASLSAKLQDLETLRLLPDPTLHFENRAVAPTSAVAPRPVLSIAAAFVAALVLGIGAVLGMHLLDPRILREEQLRRYRIPILARIPFEQRSWIPILARIPFERRLDWSGRRGPFTPGQLTAGPADGFRRLAGSLAARVDGRGNTVFVTGAAPLEGKTTTSLNLAASLGAVSEHVILVDADSRQPALTRTLALASPRGLTSVVTGRVKLADALEQSPALPQSVSVLAQEPNDLLAPVQVSGVAADSLIRDSSLLADWLLIDGPALSYAPDALPIAKRADTVVLVVHLGKTRERDLAELAELLTQQGITPDGFVVGGNYQPSYY
jgi:capsular polysaccharide biosynthesis protein